MIWKKMHSAEYKSQKKLMPKEYARKYGIGNCWKYNLPNAWRLIYSVVDTGEIKVISLILEWRKHKKYDRKFGYKRSWPFCNHVYRILQGTSFCNRATFFAETQRIQQNKNNKSKAIS